MSKSQTMIKLVAVAALLALGACSLDVELDDMAKNGMGGAASTGADIRTVTPVGMGRDELTDPNNPLARYNIHFDFDSYSAKPEYQDLLGQHSYYLQSHNQCRVLIQDNTGKHGTNEYNLALGQKCAGAVRRTSSSMDVPDSQMGAVSLGKEKPQATGCGEDSWTQSRRADIAY